MPWRTHLQAYLPLPLLQAVQTLSPAQAADVREIRLRAGQQVEWVLSPGAKAADALAWAPDAHAIARMAQGFMQHSAYAHQEELRQGYLTLPGGHRVGLCGRALLTESGGIAGLQDIASLCVRIARAVPGASDWLMPLLLSEAGEARSALVFSAPGMGKTTLLRDAVRQLSDHHGQRVCVVDERSEIAGCVQAKPQMEVGSRTDVLDACPKAVGMMLLLRAMSPQWLAVDEIGRAEDAEALLEAARCGVPVLATAHAGEIDQLLERPMMRPLLQARAFARYIRLDAGARCGGVWDAQANPLDG